MTASKIFLSAVNNDSQDKPEIARTMVTVMNYIANLALHRGDSSEITEVYQDMAEKIGMLKGMSAELGDASVHDQQQLFMGFSSLHHVTNTAIAASMDPAIIKGAVDTMRIANSLFSEASLNRVASHCIRMTEEKMFKKGMPTSGPALR